MRARCAALAAALALAGLVPPSRAEAQCVDLDSCLDYYTESHDFWTKKEMFTYLVAARAADWKTPEECGVHELYHHYVRSGVENMLATAILREDAYNPEFMAWVTFKSEWAHYDASHNPGLRWKEDGEDMFREAHLVMFKRKWTNHWKNVLHEGAHHGGAQDDGDDGPSEKALEKLEECIERDEEAEDSIMEELEEEGAFIEVENVGVKSGSSGGWRRGGRRDGGGGGGGGRPVRISCTVQITEICILGDPVAPGEEPVADDCEVYYKWDCRLASLFEMLGIRYTGFGVYCPAIPAGPLPPGDGPARVVAAIDRPRGNVERAEVDSRGLRGRLGRRWGPVRIVATR